MKTRILVIISLAAVALFSTACQSVKLDSLTAAGKKGLAAAMLSDDQMAEMAVKGIQDMDSKHTIAPASEKYGKRLVTLSSTFKEVNGRALNFKVYKKDEINAFAMPDGSIRIYSGLMDYMNDAELTFVIGHEIGHVAEGHSKQRFQVAYGTSALRDLVADQDGKVGSIASSKVGDFLETVVGAQFSQANEKTADDYGLKVVKDNGLPPVSAVNALQKLADLSKTKPGMLDRFTSTHPDPASRAARLKEAISGKK